MKQAFIAGTLQVMYRHDWAGGGGGGGGGGGRPPLPPHKASTGQGSPALAPARTSESSGVAASPAGFSGAEGDTDSHSSASMSEFSTAEWASPEEAGYLRSASMGEAGPHNRFLFSSTSGPWRDTLSGIMGKTANTKVPAHEEITLQPYGPKP